MQPGTLGDGDADGKLAGEELRVGSHFGSGKLFVGKGGAVVRGGWSGRRGVAPLVGSIGDAGVGGTADAWWVILRGDECAVVRRDVKCAALGVEFNVHLVVSITPVVVVEP